MIRFRKCKYILRQRMKMKSESTVGSLGKIFCFQMFWILDFRSNGEGDSILEHWSIFEVVFFIWSYVLKSKNFYTMSKKGKMFKIKRVFSLNFPF